MLPILQCNTVLEELWTCLAAGAKSEVLQLPAILISDALDRHPEKDNIVEAIIKLVADECLPRTMVIAACSYLLAVCGRYVRFYVTRINATLFTEISQTTFNLCAERPIFEGPPTKNPLTDRYQILNKSLPP
jgi:hypothetical protein